MRLLPIRANHVRHGAPGNAFPADRRRHRQRYERQHLPLRHLRSHPCRDPCGRRHHQGITMTINSRAAATRRDFLKSAGAATAVALTIGFEWGDSRRRALAAAPVPSAGASFTPNAFLRIGADDSVTVIAKHVEMGQGAYTGIATIVAEELDADWSRVRVESAPADAKRYANLAFGTMQGTGGSSAMPHFWATPPAARLE